MIRSVDFVDFDSDDARFFDAVRYLLDEMSPSEAEHFEEQLATDQSLRELLAEAVQLTQTTYAAHVPLTVPTEHASVAAASTTAPGNGNLPIGFFLALAASLLIAAVGSVTFYWNEANHDVAVPSPGSEELHLASAWAEQFESQSDELAELWEDDLLTFTSVDALPEENVEETFLAASPTPPPAWMLKALAAEQDDSPVRPSM